MSGWLEVLYVGRQGKLLGFIYSSLVDPFSLLLLLLHSSSSSAIDTSHPPNTLNRCGASHPPSDSIRAAASFVAAIPFLRGRRHGHIERVEMSSSSWPMRDNSDIKSPPPHATTVSFLPPHFVAPRFVALSSTYVTPRGDRRPDGLLASPFGSIGCD